MVSVHQSRGLGEWAVTWVTTADVDQFLTETDALLAADPVANSMLLTEARFWSRLSVPEPAASFGWWTEHGRAQAAFVHIPDHAAICSPLTAASTESLPLVLAPGTRLGVQARDAAAVTASWRAHRLQMRPIGRLNLLELQDFRPQSRPAGAPRPARGSDLSLLRAWFALFQARHPEDPSHVEFVVDHPLEDGGLVVWEVEGRPVGMASRTPAVAGMVRMGLAFQPTEGTTYADAAFDAACVTSRAAFDHVLVLSGNAATTAAHRSRGFEPVLDRVVLELTGPA
jgi:hypothetical protein